MTDELTQAISNTLREKRTIVGYECRNCGQVFTSGRDARQHIISRHDSPHGLKTLRESSD